MVSDFLSRGMAVGWCLSSSLGAAESVSRIVKTWKCSIQSHKLGDKFKKNVLSLFLTYFCCSKKNY